jgi:hypothetical protein
MASFPLSLSQWKYRKAFQITEQAGQNLTDYQVLLKIGESSGSSGADFHLEGLSENFPYDTNQGGDLRITDSDKKTLLSFWVERVMGTSPNRIAYVWVKIPSLNANQTKNLYIYFGKPNATNASNAENTFIKYHGFEDGTFGPFTNAREGSFGSFSVTDTIKRFGNYGCQAYDTSASDGPQRWANANTFWAQNKVAVEFWMRNDANPGSGGSCSVYFTKEARVRATISITSNGGFSYWNGSEVVFGSSNRNTWYKFVVELNYDDRTWNFRIYDSNYNQLYSYSNLSMGNISVSYNDVMMGSSSSFLGYSYWDEFFSRKWISPEPAFSSAGALEKRSSIIPLIFIR